MKNVKHVLADGFPIEDQEAAPFTYTSNQYRKEDEDILIDQAVYAENRLEVIETKRGRQDVEEANPTERISHTCPWVCQSNPASEPDSDERPRSRQVGRSVLGGMLLAALVGLAALAGQRLAMPQAMSHAEGMEAVTAWRSYLVELLYTNVELRDIDVNPLLILSVTDCRSLYEIMHREGAAEAHSEKRLCVDLAALRQMHEHEVIDSSPLKVGTDLSVWVPTAEMLADPMTKVMKVGALRKVLETGIFPDTDHSVKT